MPFNVSRSSQFYDKEVLKYPQMNLLARSVVLDGNAFTHNTTEDQRTVVPAGTILKFSVTLATRYVAYNGSGTIQGILTRPVDMLAQATAGSEPAAMFFHEAVFATTAIVSFTQYASALVSTMNTCKFE
jgi:hypothetical protein